MVAVCAHGQVTDRWQKFSDLAVEPRQLEALAARCDEFLVHGVDVEGKQLGGAAHQMKRLPFSNSPLHADYASRGGQAAGWDSHSSFPSHASAQAEALVVSAPAASQACDGSVRTASR